MKKLIIILCLVLVCTAAFGCNKKEDAGNVQLGNPWKTYDTLAEAEKAAGFEFGIPETFGNYTACVFRVMTNSLIEVTYKCGDLEVTVRKQAGEGQDISGDYTQYTSETVTDLEGGWIKVRTDGTAVSAIISCGGYSWSVYSAEGISEEVQNSFISAIIGS